MPEKVKEKEVNQFVIDGSKILADFLPLNDEIIQRFILVWDKLEEYTIQEKVLSSIFEKYPSNTNIDEVLLKCTVLNQFYSTRINSDELILLAKHIVSLNIDNDLLQGDLSVVHKIALCQGLPKYISFASKYCNWHNKKAYPIYDKYVVDVLINIKKSIGLKSFTSDKEIKSDPNIELRYEKFCNSLRELVKKYNLKSVLNNNGEIVFKLLDRALWLLGKYCYGGEISVVDIAIAMGEPVAEYFWKKYKIYQARNGAFAIADKDNQRKWENTNKALREINKDIAIKKDQNMTTLEFGQKMIIQINLIQSK